MTICAGFARAVRALWPASAAVVLSATSAAAVPPLNTLYDFTAADGSAFEFSALIEASDGNFYGSSALGGKNEYGFVYKVNRTTGRITHLHDFDFTDGATPRGSLIQGSDGDLYGTTEAGGANRSDYCYSGQFYQKGGCGTAFKVSLTGAFTKLHDFYTAADGYQAATSTGVVQASDGNFYGMAQVEFPTGATSVFKMTPAGVVSLFVQFAADGSQGFSTNTGLIQASDGNLYGTTLGEEATAAENGTVFRLSLSGAVQTLYAFQGAPSSGTGDGANPWGNLIEGSDGAFYGTTYGGGTTEGNCYNGGCGTVYRITTAGAETVLYRFTGSATDGEWPQNAGLAWVSGGTLYGVSSGNPYGSFGPPECYVGLTDSAGCGIVFELTSTGKFTALHNFGSGNGALGLFPMTSMILASDSNLYGVALLGGGYGDGVVYRVQRNAATPVIEISGIAPVGGPPGTQVVVSGKGFTGASQVTFPTGRATPVDFTVKSDTEIELSVPANGVSGAIGVTAPHGTTFSPVTFYLEPTISSLVPTSGHVGGTVNILGTHFDDITSITIGGATVTNWDYVTGADTSIDAQIPKGAVTGPIVITNPGGSATSPVFTITDASRQTH